VIIGATGHQRLPAAAVTYLEAELPRRLADRSVRRGVCCLAEGADTIFAETVLEADAELRVIVPCSGYEASFPSRQARQRYRLLLGRAGATEQLSFPAPTDAAFLAAGQRVVEECELLIAVWDGAPARGVGGTADIVAYARARRIPVVVLWPAGVTR
jgi:hypothetical protein